MDLPARTRKLLMDNANGKSMNAIETTEDLFEAGIIDSFSLVELISAIELDCGIKIPDSDVVPDKFKNIPKIEQYIDQHRQ